MGTTYRARYCLVIIIMNAWKKYSTLVCCILTCVLLSEFVCFGEAAQGTLVVTYFARVSIVFSVPVSI